MNFTGLSSGACCPKNPNIAALSKGAFSDGKRRVDFICAAARGHCGLAAWRMRSRQRGGMSLRLYKKAMHAFNNCLPTTQENTGKTYAAVLEVKEVIIAQNAKLDTLISVIEKKL